MERKWLQKSIEKVSVVWRSSESIEDSDVHCLCPLEEGPGCISACFGLGAVGGVKIEQGRVFLSLCKFSVVFAPLVWVPRAFRQELGHLSGPKMEANLIKKV